MRWMTQDLQLALRGFRRTPAFTATAVVILGLGIGMAVAMATVLDRVMRQRLPVLDQERLAVLWTHRADPGIEVSGNFKHIDENLRAETRTMAAVAAVSHWGAAPSPFVDGDAPITLNRALVTGNYFDVLGATPALGRLLRPEDEVAGGSLNVVISHGAWRRHFGGDRGIIGRRLRDAWSPNTFTIVGVAPAGLDYPVGVEIWTPPWSPQLGAYVVARLAEGVSLGAAREEFFRLESRLLPDFLLTGAAAFSFEEAMLGDVRPIIVVLSAAVLLLLVLACVNVGNLLLLRGSARARELVIRQSLGATRAAVVRQLFVESAALGVLGGALGLVVAQLLLRVLVILAPPRFPRLDALRLAEWPAGTTAGVTGIAILVFGLLPSLGAVGPRFASLRVGTRTGGESLVRRRLRQSLVASQVALALVLLAGAGLLVRSLERLTRLDLGYRADRLSIIQLAWSTPDAAKLEPLGSALLAQFQAIPGIEATTPVLLPPFLGANVFHGLVELEGQPVAERDRSPSVPLEVGDADYFRTLGIPIVRGRGFLASDRADAPLVAVIVASLAHQLWPGEDPIGKRIRYWGPDTLSYRTVVGVAGDLRFRDLREPTNTVFLPWRQVSVWQLAYAIRTRGELSTVLPIMRREVKAVDGGLTIWDAKPMDDFLAVPLAQPRLGTFLLSAFGLAALTLAAIGLYGVMAAAVRHQSHEIGVRMALGAAPARVRREVLRSALRITTSGAIIGLAVAMAAGRLLRALLFEVQPTDPVALVGASVVLVTVSLGAALIPAMRATRIDPVTALRSE